MILSIVKKELTELRRDGRVLGLSLIISLLLFLALITGLSTESIKEESIVQSETADAAAFNAQGEKNPHSAAHFSRMAHKPVAPFSSFDPGVSSFLGQVIWLEAHYRNPAMYRAAEDAPELSRLENFSLAGVLTLVIPLLTILLGYGSISSERERGTLRQLIGSGTGLQKLLVGKFIVISGILFIILLLTVLLSTVMSVIVLEETGPSMTDLLLRGLSLLLVYGLYIVSLTAITLLVSSIVTESKNALLILLAIWAITVVALPRLSASIAEQVFPSPHSQEFWAATDAKLEANRPDSESADYAAAERRVIESALGRNLEEGVEIDNLPIKARGVRFAVSELIDSEGYNIAFAELFENYAKQKNLRRLLSVFSPTIALQHLSQSFSGTDIKAHEHFSNEAESQRNTIVRILNEEIMINGAGTTSNYLAPAEFWKTVPEFRYEQPKIFSAWRQSIPDFLIMFFWGFIGIFLLFLLGRSRVEI